MSLLIKADLKFNYSWTTIAHDDPKVTGRPDSTFLNRGEGYEVLAFINSFADTYKLKQKESGLKVEHLIHKHLPSNIRSHANIKKWLLDNWNLQQPNQSATKPGLGILGRALASQSNQSSKN
jgi:hypothetical protein